MTHGFVQPKLTIWPTPCIRYLLKFDEELRMIGEWSRDQEFPSSSKNHGFPPRPLSSEHPAYGGPVNVISPKRVYFERPSFLKVILAIHVMDLCWFDFDFEVPLILPSCSAYSAYRSSAQAESGRKWNSQNQSQPNPDVIGHPKWLFTIHDWNLCVCSQF